MLAIALTESLEGRHISGWHKFRYITWPRIRISKVVSAETARILQSANSIADFQQQKWLKAYN